MCTLRVDAIVAYSGYITSNLCLRLLFVEVFLKKLVFTYNINCRQDICIAVKTYSNDWTNSKVFVNNGSHWRFLFYCLEKLKWIYANNKVTIYEYIKKIYNINSFNLIKSLIFIT